MTREIPLTQGYAALVDDEDYAWLAERKWFAWINGRYVYAMRGGGRMKSQRMHRLIVSAPAGLQVDHINGNTLDNRRANLRVCTRAQNAFNRAKDSDNTSGFKGVFAHRNRWVATLKISGKKYALGGFASPVMAARAYDKAAAEHFGEFARFNFSPHRDWLLPHEHVGPWPPPA